MTKGKHDLLLRIVKTLGAIMITVPFALCWYLYYGKDVVSPFYAKGNFMMIALFFVLFIVFGRVYGAFLMSMQRSSEIVYAQFLVAGATDLIMEPVGTGVVAVLLCTRLNYCPIGLARKGHCMLC